MSPSLPTTPAPARIAGRVSFVVPCRNSERTIEACLRSLRLSTPGALPVDAEVIVVDNHSTDGTPSLLQRLLDEGVVDELIVAGPERSAQRNLGARAASGEYVVFIDSDHVAEPGLAADVSEVFAHAGALTHGIVLPERSFGEGLWVAGRVLEKEIYVGCPEVEAARAFRTEELLALGGWREDLTAAEDWDLTDRLLAAGATIGRTRVGLRHDEGRIELRDTYRKKRYYGRWIPLYLEGEASAPGKRLSRGRVLLRRPELLARHPLAAAAMVALKTVEAAGLAHGALPVLLAERRRRTRGAELPPAAPLPTAPLPTAPLPAGEHAPAPPSRPRDPSPAAPTIVMYVGEFDEHEGMGRTILESASVLAETGTKVHVLCAQQARHNSPTDELGLAGVHVLGGSAAWGPLSEAAALRRVLGYLQPDVVHLHGGTFAPLLAAAPALRGPWRIVVSMYAWPGVPELEMLRRVGLRAAVHSNVLRPRVLVGQSIPPAALARLARRAGVSAVLTPDPRVVSRLGGHLPVHELRAGGRTSELRAQPPAFEDAAPRRVVFLGRAERVRGILELADAVAILARTLPGLQCRLVLLPTAELPALQLLLDEHPARAHLEVVLGASADVHAELAAAHVGVWPFLFDYTTSPPALAVVEAMSVGLPVVVTDVACLTAVAHEGNAELVSPGDVDALVTSMRRVLTDPDRWEQLHTQGVLTSLRDTRHTTSTVLLNAYALPGGAAPQDAASRDHQLALEAPVLELSAQEATEAPSPQH